MRLVFFVQKMPDPCGAFFHDIMLGRALQYKGHSVTFVTTGSKFPQRGTYRGIQFVYYQNAGNELERADLWCSPHNPMLPLVRKLNERFEKPLVVAMHYGEDTKWVQHCNRTGNWAEFLWVVSDHINRTLPPIAPSFVERYVFRAVLLENELKFCEPPNRPEGNCITLINANILKGLPIFVDLAKRFPNKQFLGVRPYYNQVQVPTLPNIEWIDFNDDIRVVLKRTRVLLVPSLYESWGRVAFEAMYNGIPVLYTKPLPPDTPGVNFKTGTTEGMAAWIGDNGFACSRLSETDWVNAINALDDPDSYNTYSDKSFQCARDMNIFAEYANVEQKFIGYATKHGSRPKTKGEDKPLQQQGLNRFMAGGFRPIARMQPKPQAPKPNPAPQPAAASARPAPRQPSFGLVGGRFGMKR